MTSATTSPDYVSTTDACKLCMPLGACLAFKGVEGAAPFLHGSQGCATYMRRYLISHFREPVDIASSSLGENQAIFGGGPNLKKGLVNVINKYGAKVVGIATTCLTETIGDDVPGLVREFLAEAKVESPDGQMPALITVPTPAYGGSHVDGFHAAVLAMVSQLAQPTPAHGGVNLLPGFVSPADLRRLAAVTRAYGLRAALAPDYSRTLDAPAMATYEALPAGGVSLNQLRAMGGAKATIELGHCLPGRSAGGWLETYLNVPLRSLGLPMGVRACDALHQALRELSGRDTPEEIELERGRLIDAMIDGHKYLSGKTAVIYGDEDMVVGVAGWLAELGVRPALCATGGKSGRFPAAIAEVTEGLVRQPAHAVDGVDFQQIGEMARQIGPDILVGNSKGYRLARELGVPLVRVGFPIHDRFGGQRLLCLDYQGSQELMDRVINAILAHDQDRHHWGYGYL